MEDFKHYRKSQTVEMRPYVEGESVSNITVAPEDRKIGSPQEGDMIARNPHNHNDQWLVSKKYFDENYVEAGEE